MAEQADTHHHITDNNDQPTGEDWEFHDALTDVPLTQTVMEDVKRPSSSSRCLQPDIESEIGDPETKNEHTEVGKMEEFDAQDMDRSRRNTELSQTEGPAVEVLQPGKKADEGNGGREQGLLHLHARDDESNSVRSDSPSVELGPTVTINLERREIECVADSQNYWRLLFIMFLIADTVLFCVILLAGFHMGQHSGLPYVGGNTNIDIINTTVPGVDNFAVCLPCVEVYRNFIDFLENPFKVTVMEVNEGATSWKNRLCCTRPHDDLKTFSNRYLDIQYARSRAKGDMVNSKPSHDLNPAVMLDIDHNAHPTKVNAMDKVPLTLSRKTTFSTSASSATTHHSMSLKNGSVHFMQSGVFFVYCRLPLQLGSSHPELSQIVISRSEDGRERLLLENKVFRCESHMQNSCEYSVVGGLVRVQEQDELSLRVSNYAAVNKQKPMAFGVQQL